MIIDTAEQGTPEWRYVRAGKFTASTFADLMATKRDGSRAASFNAEVWRVVVERLTGIPFEKKQTAEMRWGNEVEPFARDRFELETGEICEKVGFITSQEYQFIGCSPDSLIASRSEGVEIKCPTSKVHLSWIMDGVVPEEHAPQCQGGMLVTKAERWWFMSYDPRMPKHLRHFILPVSRDNELIEKILATAQEAEIQAKAILNKLTIGE